jgi:hypothetical protein
MGASGAIKTERGATMATASSIATATPTGRRRSRDREQ